MSVITGKEYLLEKIFSSDFSYTIPAGQRPYSWEERHAEDLFEDLYDFFVNNPPTNNISNDNHYFLGSIVITKKNILKPDAEVTDGQQRLTTLTILLSTIAAFFSNGTQDNLYNFVWERGNAFTTNNFSAPRLTIRSQDQKFFEENIQKELPGKAKLTALEKFVADTNTLETESQMKIRANCGVFLRKIKNTFGNFNGTNFQIDLDRLKNFCSFLMTRCYLVVVSTDDSDTSYRIFTVINARGMDLSPADLIKAKIIGNLPSQNQQQIYADKWEDLEIQAKRQGFGDVFSHLRMIYVKKKAQGTLLKEFNNLVMPEIEKAATAVRKHPSIYLIDDLLEPYVKAYVTIKKQNYSSTNPDVDAEINNFLMWLNKIDNDDWIPSTMKFFMDKSGDPNYLRWFVQKMERLSAYMHITSYSINQRINRYEQLLTEMEKNPGHNLSKPLESVELTDEEKQDFLSALDGEIYRLTARRRSYVILRLDSFVAAGQNSNYNPAILSIEHVLPQTVDKNSQWATWWQNPDERDKWLHKIANLVPLTRRHNSAAQNHDFSKKKTDYFKNKNGTISYPLTTQVISEKDWTPATVQARQKNLLDTFKKNWEL